MSDYPPDYPPSAANCYHHTAALHLPARTTHIAKDLTTKMASSGWYANHAPERAITAACIFAASKLMGEGEHAQVEEIMRVLEVEHEEDFWTAYEKVWEKRYELVTGEIQCHGADVERLPGPKAVEENGVVAFRQGFFG